MVSISEAVAAGLFSMGRRQVSKKAVTADTNGAAEEGDVKSPSTPQHDLGDMAGLKRGLDDCALNVAFYLDHYNHLACVPALLMSPY